MSMATNATTNRTALLPAAPGAWPPRRSWAASATQAARRRPPAEHAAAAHGAAAAGLAGGLQHRARRAEHEPQVRNDGAVPPGDDRPSSARPTTAASRSSTRPRRTARTRWSASSAKPMQPFRDKVVITSKFGWNIDPETGRAAPGAQQQARAHQARRRRDAQAPSHRPHRPPLPAPGRSRGPDRGRRRRGQGPDGRRARSCTGASRRWGSTRCAGRTPRCRSPPSRTSTRCCGAGPRRRSSRPARSSASASCPWSPLGGQFLTGCDRREHALRPRRHPRRRVPVLAGEPAAQPGARRPGQALGRTEAGRSRPDRAGVAAGAEAVDRAHPRDDADGAHGREHRRGRRAIHRRPSSPS